MEESKHEDFLPLFACLLFPAMLGDRTLLIVFCAVACALGFFFRRHWPPFSLWFLPLGMCMLYGTSLIVSGYIPGPYLAKKVNFIWIPLAVWYSAFYTSAQRDYFVTRSLSVLCLLLIFNGLLNYGWSHNPEFISYHGLSESFKFNAIYLSAYTALGHFIFAERVFMRGQKLSTTDWLSWICILFGLIMLSSKLVLICCLLVPAGFMIFSKIPRLWKWLSALCITLLFASFSLLPVGKRFSYEFQETQRIMELDHFDQATYFTGTAIRLVLSKFSLEIMHEQGYPFLGTGMGNMQPLLNKKIISSGMYFGDGSEGNAGFVGYNAHNQYLTLLVESGWPGLIAFVFLLGWMFRESFLKKNYALVFQIVMLALLGLTENYLEVYYKGTFLFAMIFGMVCTRPPTENSSTL